MQNFKEVKDTKDIKKRFNVVFPQARGFAILTNIIPIIAYLSIYFFDDAFSSFKDVFLLRWHYIIIFSSIISVPCMLISVIKKEYYGVFALAPSIVIWIYLFEIKRYTSCFLPICYSFGLYSMIYLIIKREISKFTLLSSFLVMGIVYFGMLAWAFYLVNLAVLIFCCYAICYSIYHSIKDNMKLFSILGKTKFLYKFLKAFLLWSPLILVILPGFYFSSVIDQLAIRVDRAILESPIPNQISAPENLIEPEKLECGLNLICHINPWVWVQKEMNNKYRGLELNKKLQELKSSERISNTRILISQIFKNTFEISSLISRLLLYFLIISSFLYVLSRIVISAKDGIPATLSLSDENIQKGSITSHSNEYALPISKKEKYYFVRTLEPDGREPNLKLPQWNKSVLARILSKSYTMNVIETDPELDPVRFTTTWQF